MITEEGRWWRQNEAKGVLFEIIQGPLAVCIVPSLYVALVFMFSTTIDFTGSASSVYPDNFATDLAVAGLIVFAVAFLASLIVFSLTVYGLRR